MDRSDSKTVDLNRRQFSKLVGSGALVGLAGCASSDSEDGDFYDHVRVALHAEPSTLNPYYEGLDREQLNIQVQSYEHLLHRNDEMEIQPNLATSWEPDGEDRWLIELRDDVTFHNGTEMTAETVAGSFELMRNEDLSPGLAGHVESITEVEVTGDYSLALHTDGFDPTLPSRLTTYTMIVEPEHYRNASDEERSTQPMGTGPFILEEWDQGNEIVFTRNEDWWRGTPQIAKLTFNIVPEPSTRVNALTQDDAELAVELPANLAPQVESSSDVEITNAASVRVLWMEINPTEEPFGQPAVRQAVNYAVDKNTIVEELFGGYGQVTSQGVPESCFGYNPDIDPYPYEPDTAESLLSEAGYSDGFSTTLRTTEELSELSQAVAGYLREVGIETEVEIMEPESKINEFLDDNAAPLESLDWGNFSLFDAAGTYPYCFHSEGIWGYTGRPELDEMIDEAMATVDRDEREQKWFDVGQEVHDKGDKLFLFAQNAIHGKDTQLDAFTARSDNVLHLDDTRN